MDEKTKELIAIGASITAHCQPCLKYHISQALNLGISTDEISEAISVGKTVEKGALKTMDNFSKEQMENLNPSKTISKPEEPDSGCGCGDSCCSL